MMNNYVDQLALDAARAIEDEFAKGHIGGVTQHTAAIQAIVTGTIGKVLNYATDGLTRACAALTSDHCDNPKASP